MILDQLKQQPETLQFADVINYIDTHYNFTPRAFKNGDVQNEENQNNGSCKIFSFAKLQNLSKEETLALFGDFYRKDVLENPEREDHQNIRNFMIHGWDGIEFSASALSTK